MELMQRSLPHRKMLKDVKHIIVVSSGKGGVGKFKDIRIFIKKTDETINHFRKNNYSCKLGCIFVAGGKNCGYS